ncbi:hypothetical protein [Chitinilyticum litopenaei]|uniref:hypothetical protein n=1 Tax=Chitinilyticum litopenaei TaxID=1121276 RepID=UPI00048FDF49|nr:hypothetical protein [Chitinilyticum litopenaei]
MSVLTNCAVALAAGALAMTSQAAPLRIGPLPLDTVISGPVSNWQQQEPLLQFELGDHTLSIENAGLANGVDVRRLSARAQREAHPAGPQTRLYLQRDGRDWLLLAAGLHPGASLPEGWTLFWQDRPMLADAGGHPQTVPVGGRLARHQGRALCLRILDVRVPAADDIESEPEIDLLLWRSQRRDCRKPGI